MSRVHPKTRICAIKCICFGSTQRSNKQTRWNGDHWYAVFSVEYEFDPTLAFHPSTEEVGIDVGLKSYAVLSNGSTIENPRLYRRTEHNMKKAHQKLARRKFGSHRRNQAKKELARLARTTRHRRQDFLHNAAR